MSTENLQTDVDKEAISKFNHEFNLLFKKSDALKRLKEVSETLDLASFKKFSLVAMKTAYDKNRFKAVDMMLNFHEQNYPPLLLQLHLAVLLNNKSSDDYPGDNMLKVITQHYTSDFILEKLEDIKNKILDILNSNTNTKTENAYKEIQQFDWKNVSGKMLSYFRL